jgi:uncharacterized membrane protein YidH (DUF202 family)
MTDALLSTLLIVVVGVALAAVGAWQTARCRHDLERQHRRRRTDP